jgi:hypothetical protein
MPRMVNCPTWRCHYCKEDSAPASGSFQDHVKTDNHRKEFRRYYEQFVSTHPEEVAKINADIQRSYMLHSRVYTVA